jgi:hypothetical protein
MNTQQSTVTRFTKPEWADESASYVTDTDAVWSRTVHRTEQLHVDVVQMEDLEAVDAPIVRAWVGDLVIEAADAASLTEIGVGIAIGAHQAHNIIAGTAHTWAPATDTDGAPLSYADVEFESTLPAKKVVTSHYVSRDDDGTISVLPATVNGDLTLEEARRYLVEVARAIAVAEAAS